MSGSDMIELPDIGPIWRERMADLGFTDEQIQGIEEWCRMEGERLREARLIDGSIAPGSMDE